MAKELTEAEVRRQLQKRKDDEKEDRILSHVNALRLTEGLVNGATSVGLGALKAGKPTWEEAAYGMPIDGTALGVGLVVAILGLSSKGKGMDYVAELGAGIAQAAIGSLGQKGGRVLYNYMSAP